jgi:hypothetical protein
MDFAKSLNKRLTALEARYTLEDVPGDSWPPLGCDSKRRLERYAAYFEGRSWECTGNPEQKARRDANLARYKAYFDNLGVHVDDDGSLNNLNSDRISN